MGERKGTRGFTRLEFNFSPPGLAVYPSPPPLEFTTGAGPMVGGGGGQVGGGQMRAGVTDSRMPGLKKEV